MTIDWAREIATAMELGDQRRYEDGWEALIRGLRAGDPMPAELRLPRHIYIYRRGVMETWHLQSMLSNANAFEVARYVGADGKQQHIYRP